MLSRTNAAILPDTGTMRTLMAMVVLASFGCGIAAAEPAPKAATNAAASPAPNGIPLPRPRPKIAAPPPWIATGWTEPKTFREAAGPEFKTSEVTNEASACRLRLEKFAVVTPMPRLIGPGNCGGGDIVRLDAVTIGGSKPSEAKRIEIKPAPYLQCPMAEQLALWVRDDSAPQVAATGGVLLSVETYDDFDCRGRNRKMTGKVSEHGKANAVDLKGFTLQDGRYIHLTDIKADRPLREGVRRSACTRFMTVLGPGSDGYHEEHIHLDLAERRGDYRICQWDVREPPPPPKVPEKPAEVAAAPEPNKPETKPQIAAAHDEPDEDDNDKIVMSMNSPIQGAVPLPKRRPQLRTGRRKSRDLFHLPFNLLR
jgi:hypothetical protein